MKKYLTALVVVSLFSSVNANATSFSNSDLKALFEKEDTVYFYRELKDKEIVINGMLRALSYTKYNKSIWFTVKVNDGELVACAVPRDESKAYDDVKIGDSITMSGKIASIGNWSTTGKYRALYLKKGCAIKEN
jgi:hypothetical protein